MSTTEELEDLKSNEYKNSTYTKKKCPKIHIPEDIQEEIQQLLENVQEIDEIFHVQNKIGSGTFSSVYVASLKKHPEISEKFALKYIIPTSHPSRIESELRCLQQMGGRDNVMGVRACVRNKDHVVIVMPYFYHDRFQEYVQDVTPLEVQEYMKNLLIALRRVHSKNMMHRDVKPSNFLVNRKKHLYSLVDFGLAQKVNNKEQNATPSGSKPATKSPHSSSTGGVGRSPLLPKQIKNSSPKKRKANPEETSLDSPKKIRSIEDLQDTAASATNSSSLQNKENPVTVVKIKENEPENTVSEVFEKNEKTKSPRRQLLTKKITSINRVRTSSTLSASHRKLSYKSIAPTSCQCFGQPSVCTICLSRTNQIAPRAGTPGFRSPEVLMKCPDQTTAIDIWSAGVIFLSLLSGRYPFFKAEDDITSLAQIMSVVGSQEMLSAAQSYGKSMQASPWVPAADYRQLCQKLRGFYINRTKSKSLQSCNSDTVWSALPDSTFDLLKQMLHPDPGKRLSAADALNHSFFSEKL